MADRGERGRQEVLNSSSLYNANNNEMDPIKKAVISHLYVHFQKLCSKRFYLLFNSSTCIKGSHNCPHILSSSNCRQTGYTTPNDQDFCRWDLTSCSDLTYIIRKIKLTSMVSEIIALIFMYFIAN